MVKLHNRCRGAYGELLRLPFEGGLLQQPNWILAAFDIIASAQADTRKKLS